MIDEKKYEGHTPAPWVIAFWDRQWYVDDEDGNTVCELNGIAQKKDPTAKLIADAPLLLAEVKRLRERVKTEKNLKLWEKAEVKRLRDGIKDILEYHTPNVYMTDALQELIG
tara:strand:- start:340 stop:675 length:336 start_codon:yes stop_codon:yes gene_type:complete